MTDEEDIRRVLARYSQWCDDGRFDDFARLFTEDAEFRVMGQCHTGRTAITEFMAAAQPPERRGRHVITNPVIRVDAAEGTATGVTDYVFLSAPAPDTPGAGFTITNVGRYHDRFVKEHDGQWRFVAREIVFFGDGPTT